MCPGQSDSKPCGNTESTFNSQLSIFNWNVRSLRIYISLFHLEISQYNQVDHGSTGSYESLLSSRIRELENYFLNDNHQWLLCSWTKAFICRKCLESSLSEALQSKKNDSSKIIREIRAIRVPRRINEATLGAVRAIKFACLAESRQESTKLING